MIYKNKFIQFPLKDITELFQHEMIRVEKGEYLFNEGKENNSVYFIVSGKVKVIKKKVVIGFTQDLEFVGITSCLCDGLNYYFSAIAVEQSILYQINKKVFLEKISQFPEFGKKIIELLCKRIELTNVKTSSIINETPFKRIIRELLINLNYFNNKKIVYLSISDLSELVGISLNLCKRILRELKHDKYVKIPYGSHEIEIIDEEFLRELLTE